MKEGNYLAKIIDYGVGETKAGDPNIFVKFQTNSNETITWFGYLKSDKSIEITMKSLFKMGFRKNELDILADGMSSNALTVSRDYELVIVEEDYEGKKRNKVRFINFPGESGGNFERLSKAEAVTKLSGFKGHVMALKQAEGIKDEVTEEDFGF